ncbi:hypothetical protein [Streptomyces sp. YIM 98790]|uniref:hypothetical protein n=1 Tax=Streptomyces sp. YIM 98790 TaxID=2689077 RepID=UPI00140AEBE1|nr:hypothetical protein [Streptomyces sp. YIM 98790]
MSHDSVNSVLVLAIALRVLAPDARALVRWVLGVGVRVGADALAERRHPHRSGGGGSSSRHRPDPVLEDHGRRA